MSKKNVVTENEGRGLASNEISPNDEGLGQTLRTRLNRVGQDDSPLVTVPKESPKEG